MVEYVPTEKAMPIREPSLANLLIDSQDRRSVQPDGNVVSFPTAGQFRIQKANSILNGFFTRIGVSEVCLDWAVPNISAATQWGSGFANNVFTVNITGALANPYTLTVPVGFYNVAQVLDAMVVQLNTVGTGTFSISQDGGQVAIACDVNYYFTSASPVLISQLGLPNGVGSDGTSQVVGGFGANTNNLYNAVDLRTFMYLDFVCNDLTYCQELKDGTTQNSEKDVLCRFYLSWDNPPLPDAYGFPILPGYSKFTLRRQFSTPKQIRWEPNMPIGNLSFQVFGKLLGLTTTNNYQQVSTPLTPYFQEFYDWQMTLQVSEV
jgi:hypothetical protein